MYDNAVDPRIARECLLAAIADRAHAAWETPLGVTEVTMLALMEDGGDAYVLVRRDYDYGSERWPLPELLTALRADLLHIE